MKNKLPILNYHGIDTTPSGYDWQTPEMPYVLNVQAFEKQLNWIRNSNYETLDLAKLKNWLAPHTETKHALMITFDDGHKSHFEFAAPRLKERNLKALFFVPSGLVAKKGQADWNDLKQMVKDGFEIGGHGWNHIPLTNLDEKDLLNEFTQPKRELEDKLGVPIKSYSIPRGFFHPRFQKIAQDAGYEFLFTSQFEYNDVGENPMCLKRIVIKTETSFEDFSKLLKGEIGMQRYVEKAKESARKILPPAFYDALAGLKQALKK
jgi:peptidoglycan/xylan/chitin deacetylase (PgdA/CDA1 family)